MTDTTTNPKTDTMTRLWPALSFENADRMTDWLLAVGFTAHQVYRSDDATSDGGSGSTSDGAAPDRAAPDSDKPDQRGSITHAELVWPGGGGIMFGTHDPDNKLVTSPGQSSIYLVTDDVPAALRRAVDAGATVVRDVVEEPYGGQAATARDPEGNTWTFGQYQPS
jgi:uncharacterized glyoxalase superfamily protein PhnB